MTAPLTAQERSHLRARCERFADKSIDDATALLVGEMDRVVLLLLDALDQAEASLAESLSVTASLLGCPKEMRDDAERNASAFLASMKGGR